jgi:hypothetical protein
MFSSCRHYLQISGQFHAPTALSPGERVLGTLRYWRLAAGQKRNIVTLSGNELQPLQSRVTEHHSVTSCLMSSSPEDRALKRTMGCTSSMVETQLHLPPPGILTWNKYAGHVARTYVGGVGLHCDLHDLLCLHRACIEEVRNVRRIRGGKLKRKRPLQT